MREKATNPDSITWTMGIAAAICAQFLWGVFPAYIKLFQGLVQPQDLVAHRAIWSFVVLVVWIAIVSRRRTSDGTSLKSRMFGDRSTLGKALLATVFILTNWLIFVWAVSNDHALDASLGYYICPLFMVLLGVVILREQLGRNKWIAIGLAALGVTIMTWSADSRIWIGLGVAVAFASYAFVKKKTRLSAAEGLTLETGFLLVPAILFLAWRSTIEGVVALPDSFRLGTLLFLCGPMTVAPLFLYAFALKHVSLSTIGLLQFIGPTIQFILGVFFFGESFDSMRLIGFVFVWIGVILYLLTLARQPIAKAT